MLTTDWDIRSGIASAVDDRAPEEMWPPRELSHRSPRQDAHFLGQSASRRDAHIRHVNTLDGALLQKLFRATVEERRRATAQGKATTPRDQIKPSEEAGQVWQGVSSPKREGFYLPSDLVTQGKTILKTMPEAVTKPESIVARRAAQEPAAAQEEASAVLVIPAQRPAVATISKKAAKKAARKAKLELEQDEQQPELALAPEDGTAKMMKKKSKQGKEKAPKIPSEHAEADARSWIELGESNIPPRDDNAGSQRKSDVLSAPSRRDWDVRESGKSASRCSHNEASPHWPDHANSSLEGEQPQSEARQPDGGNEKKRSTTSRAEMQATVESVVSHASAKVLSEHSRDRPASRESKSASNKSKRNSAASRQASETVWSRGSVEDNDREEAKYEDGRHEVAEDATRGSRSRSSRRKHDHRSHISADSHRSGRREKEGRVSRSKTESNKSMRSSKKEEGGSHRSSHHSKHDKPNKDGSLGAGSPVAPTSRKDRISQHSSRRSSERSNRWDDDDLAIRSDPKVSQTSSQKRAQGSHHSSRRPAAAMDQQDEDVPTEPKAKSPSSRETSSRSRRSSHHTPQDLRTTASLENAYLEQTIAENLAESEQISERHHGSPHHSNHSSHRHSKDSSHHPNPSSHRYSKQSSHHSNHSSHRHSKHSSHHSRRKDQEDDGWHEVDRHGLDRSKSPASDRRLRFSHTYDQSRKSDGAASKHSSHRSPESASTQNIDESTKRDRTSAVSDLYASRRRHASPRESKHSSMTSFGRSFVGVPIYGIVSTPGGHEGVVSAPQVSDISEPPSEQRQDRHRPTVFAGKGWISPHPLSRSPTDVRSPPAPMIILPSQANPQGATMTYEEWQAIQENGLRKHRNFSFTESSQTWHARQQDERYRFPGWEARSWVEIDPSPVDVREDSMSSENVGGGSDRTVRTIGSDEISRRSGSSVRTVGSDEVSRRSGSAVRTSRSDEESRRSGSDMSRGPESRHSTVSYQPKEPTSSPSELLWQEMEEGNGGWS